MWPGRSHTEGGARNWRAGPAVVLSLVLVKANSPAMTLEESCDGS